jgi:NADH dehydrogenase
MLQSRGVQVILNTRVKSATANAVFLSNGECIETCLFLSTAGNGPTEFCQSLQLPLARGKITVEQTLRVRGENNIWALGDAALVPLDTDGERFAPPTAQYAVREAKCLARNISAVIQGRDSVAFDFTPRGVLASIGNYKGVARLFGINFSGLPAWMLWRFAYIGMLPGFSTRLRVALNWLFDYFLPRSIVQIANREMRSTSTRRYAKGDVLSKPGQYVDGLYAVLEGQLVSRIPRRNARGDHIRILGPGDHWGEVLASAGELTHGTLTAIEDTRVLIFRADDFRSLRQALPALENYFEGIDPSVYAPSLRVHAANKELAH